MSEKFEKREGMHLVAVYGSLRQGFGNHRRLEGHGDNVRFVGITKTPANYTMVSLGGFPGLIPTGNQEVVIEVYEVSNDVLLGPLDSLEGYSPENESRSFYLRRTVETEFGTAWIYLLGDNYLSHTKVESGDWKEFKKN